MDGEIILQFYNAAKDYALILNYTQWIMISLLTILVLCMYKQKRAVINAIIAAVLVWIINLIIHGYIYIPRPFVQYGIEPLIKHSATSSFPSDHAGVSFAIAVSLMFYNKKIGIIAVFAAFAIVTIRVIAMLHYPIDAIAGTGLGTISAILIWTALRRYKNG